MVASTADAVSFDERQARSDNRRKLFWGSVVFLLMVVYPFIDKALGIGRVGALEAIFVFVILAMGLNIVTGYAGLLDLGYAAFFAIGAYSQAFLTSPSSVLVQKGIVPGFLQHFWPAMAISWAVAAVFGVLLGAPTLRLRGDYLAIVTLGFGEIVPRFFVNASHITNGPNGISQIATPPPVPLPGTHALTFTATDQRNWYWLMLLVGLFSLLVINRLADSRLGRSWMAVREDEIAASSMGINLVSTKLWAFALGASFAGFAGAVYAGYLQVVFPDQFDFTVSVMVLSMVILGGLGNIYGVIFGGLLIQSFDRIFAEEINRPLHWLGDTLRIGFLQNHDVTQDRLLIFGLAIVLMMLLRPGGLFPDPRRKAELVPESEDIRVAETEQLYDVRHENEPALGERA
jgi:branched-chain amino acid transport system permease protein